jgi:hypothetical protein
MSKILNAELFETLLNQNFNLHLKNNTILVIRLIEVTKSEVEGDDIKRIPFSVVFRGPREILIPQGIYSIENESAGILEIFLVPIGPDKKGMRFEAVFN